MYYETQVRLRTIFSKKYFLLEILIFQFVYNLFRTVTEIEKQPKTIVIPRYQPVFVEPNLKEYETQVLQMSVPIGKKTKYIFLKNYPRRQLPQINYFALFFFTDDTERMNFEYPPNRNLRYAPSFSIDNISYITKDRTGN